MAEEKPVHVPRDRYPELIYPATVTPSLGGEYSEETVHFMDYWRVIATRRWTIFAVLATVVIVTTIYTVKQTPIYQATASIQIDKENPNILSFKDVYAVDAEDDTLRTQFEVLKSRSLARRVIEQLKLDRVGEFQPDASGVFGSAVQYIRDFFSSKRIDSTDPDHLRPIIDAYLDRLDVAPVRQARLVEIHFESKDPELAAR